MNFPIEVSDLAVREVARLIKKDGREGLALRLGVKGGGCSGLEYLMKLDDQTRESDLRLEKEGVLIVCDPKSAKFLEGATFTFTGSLIGGGFKFENPNATRSCGCGTSFTPKS